MSNRSDEALRERLELAKKATPGPWKSVEVLFRKKNFEPSYVVKDGDGRTIVDIISVAAYQATAGHIAASSSDVVRADLEEIIALRAEVARLREENESLKNSAFEFGVVFSTKVNEMRSREEWLARHLATHVQACDYEPLCPMPGYHKCEFRPGPGYSLCQATDGERAECWRKAADMATRENPGSFGEVPENPGEGK